MFKVEVSMEEYIQFIQQEWLLASIFVGLLVALLLLTWRERAIGASRVDPQQATHLINKEQGLVVDLRDNAAFLQGHIAGAKNIPHTRLAQSEQELAKYKEKPLILVCEMGRQSGPSGMALRKLGFTRVYMLAGGIQAWRAAGLPLTKTAA
jgi:rhodanese-related sulfurtransferase